MITTYFEKVFSSIFIFYICFLIIQQILSINVSLLFKPLPTKPVLRIVEVTGGQRLDKDIEIKNDTSIKFFLHWPASLPVSKCTGSSMIGCYEVYTFDKMGVLYKDSINNTDSGDPAIVGSYAFDKIPKATYSKIEITIPSFNAAGSYGFSIQFLNGISSIKYGLMDIANGSDNMKPATETIQLLDPGPLGTGEWVRIEVPKWDFQWVI